MSEVSGVRDATLLVAVDLRASKRRSDRDALVRVASSVDAAWIESTHMEITHEIDPKTGKVRALERQLYEKMELSRKPANVDPARAARMLCEAMVERGIAPEIEADLRRIRFAGLPFDLDTRLLAACHGKSGWFRFDPIAALAREERRELDRRAPEHLEVPSGRKVCLDYVAPGEVHASVKLQELFGLARTPRVGDPAVAVTLRLLAPNGRPVQTTQDLKSFWENTYGEVRKQLRGRYPKHPWPEDPWNATPTARTRRRRV